MNSSLDNVSEVIINKPQSNVVNPQAPVVKKQFTRLEKIFAFIERFCLIPEGPKVGKPFILADFQREIIEGIYGPDKNIRRAIISMGRKNSKTTLTALIVLIHLIGPESKQNSQIFSSAMSREQASLVFTLAAKMIRLNPALNKYFNKGIRDSKKEIYCLKTGVTYKALSADASTALGLSPVLLIHDELGQVKGPRSQLYDFLESAMGAAESPLSIVISTQAPTDKDLLSILIDDQFNNQSDDVYLYFKTFTERQDGPDPFSEEALKEANPAYDIFLNKKELLTMADEAKRIPSREAPYRNLFLNQRIDAKARFISRTIWKQNGGQPESLEGLKVYGGLDLSSTQDLTALVLVGQKDNKVHIHPTFWLPEEGLSDKAMRDRVPYDVWKKQGFLRTTPGKTVDYSFIAKELKSVFQKYKIETIAFDRWKMDTLKAYLKQDGFTDQQMEQFKDFGQGFRSMSPALAEVETLFLNNKLQHGDHPILTMCAMNSVIQQDDAENRKLTKSHSFGRIDGMVALTMAISMMVQPKDEQKQPQIFFIDRKRK